MKKDHSKNQSEGEDLGDVLNMFALVGLTSVVLAGGAVAVRSAGQDRYKQRLKEAAKTSAITFTIWAFALPAVCLYFGLGQLLNELPKLFEKPAEVEKVKETPIPPGYEDLLKEPPPKDSVGRKTHNPVDEYLEADKKKD